VLQAAAAENDGFWLVGTSASADAHTRVWRLSSIGQVLWTADFSVFKQLTEKVRAVIPLPNGDLLLAGDAGGSFVARIQVAEGTSVEDELPTRAASLSVFPNPAQGGVTFEFGSDRSTSAELRIFDVMGRIVRTFWQGDFSSSGTTRVHWDAQDARGERISAGLYLAVLTDGSRIRSASCVISSSFDLLGSAYARMGLWCSQAVPRVPYYQSAPS